MIRALTRLGVVVGAGAVSLAAWQGPIQGPSFRGGTQTVSVWATVLDADGRLVPNLTRDDFEVFDNGVRQDVSIFVNDVQPITVVVMLDRSWSVRAHFNRVRDAAQAFVNNLRDDDRARIGSFSQQVLIDPETFTSDRKVLTRILREKLQDQGPTPLWNATAGALDALHGQPGRRVVLLFTDGSDDPGTTRRYVPFREVRARVETEEAMVYGIGLTEACDMLGGRRPGPTPQPSFQRRGPFRFPPPRVPMPRFPPNPGIPVPPPSAPRPPGGDDDDDRNRDVRGCVAKKPDPLLRELTEIGGGGYFELDSVENMSKTFARVADELHEQYLLAFTPAAIDNAVHRLEVRVKNPEMSVRARRSYVASSAR